MWHVYGNPEGHIFLYIENPTSLVHSESHLKMINDNIICENFALLLDEILR